MAWTTPLTAVANATLTAAQWNASVRDNLNETAVAKATTISGYFVATGANAIVERIPDFDGINTAESSISTSFTDLATVGPQVTATTGARALYMLSARQQNDTDNAGTESGVDITGASTIGPSSNRALTTDGVPGGNALRMSTAHLESNLSAGSNVFTMQYRVSSGEGTWGNRNLVVLPY